MKTNSQGCFFEFKNFIEGVVEGQQLEWISLGDEVNGIPVSQGVVITVNESVLA